MRLLADGEEVKAQDITEEMNWTYTFEDLDKNKKGKLINYTITEDEVSYYETTIEGYEITNKHEVIKTEVNVEKVWDDFDDKDKLRPGEVVVNLLADGVIIDSLKLNKENNYKNTFKELDAYKDGELIKYSLEEEKIEEYSYVIDYNQEESEDLKVEVKPINSIITNHHDLRPEVIKTNPITNSLIKIVSVIFLIGISAILIINNKKLLKYN